MRWRTLAAVTWILAGCAPRGFHAGRFAERSWQALTTPTAPPPVHVPQPYRRDARLAVLWIGHATALIQLDDKVILTDPVFTSRVGGLSPRLVAPGLAVTELPQIDAALVSHMHFDHLSFDSLRMIASRTRTLILPQDGLDYVHPYSFEEVELPAWQSWEQGGLKITAVPVKHLGWRWGFDAFTDPRSFTGYVIEYHGLSVYFSGDSALDLADFEETRRRFPHLDVALLAIGPIQPREFMKRVHMDPAEALQAFDALGARYMVPIHFGTFINSADEEGDDLRALEAALAARPALRPRVVVLQIGEQHLFARREEGDKVGPQTKVTRTR